MNVISSVETKQRLNLTTAICELSVFCKTFRGQEESPIGGRNKNNKNEVKENKRKERKTKKLTGTKQKH